MTELNPEHQRTADLSRARVMQYINNEILPRLVGGYENDDDPNEGKNG